MLNLVYITNDPYKRSTWVWRSIVPDFTPIGSLEQSTYRAHCLVLLDLLAGSHDVTDFSHAKMNMRDEDQSTRVDFRFEVGPDVNTHEDPVIVKKVFSLMKS